MGLCKPVPILAASSSVTDSGSRVATCNIVRVCARAHASTDTLNRMHTEAPVHARHGRRPRADGKDVGQALCDGGHLFPGMANPRPDLLDRRQAVPHDRREHLRQGLKLALREGERVRHELAHRCRHLPAGLFVCFVRSMPCRAACLHAASRLCRAAWSGCLVAMHVRMRTRLRWLPSRPLPLASPNG